MSRSSRGAGIRASVRPWTQGDGLFAIWGVDKDVWVVGGKSSALVLRR